MEIESTHIRLSYDVIFIFVLTLFVVVFFIRKIQIGIYQRKRLMILLRYIPN